MNLTETADRPAITPEEAFETLQVLERETARVIVGQPILIFNPVMPCDTVSSAASTAPSGRIMPKLL